MRPGGYRLGGNLSLALGGLALGGLALVRRRWTVFTVQGNSMWRTYPAGSRIVVRRSCRSPRRGDVVIVPRPDPATGWRRVPTAYPDGEPAWFLKRVVAVGGDRPLTSEAALLADDELYLLGETDGSWDSRRLGPCPADAVSGVVVGRLSSSARAVGR